MISFICSSKYSSSILGPKKQVWISGELIFLLFLHWKARRSPVGLVQDQDLDVTQLKAGGVVEMVNQPAGCSY